MTIFKLKENKIKLIFDNVRNFGIAALLAAVGIGIMQIEASELYRQIYFYIIGGVMILFSIFLFILNIDHAKLIVFPNEEDEKALSKKVVCLYAFLFALYLVCAVPLYSYLIAKNLISAL